MTREKSYLPRNVWEQGMWVFSLKSIQFLLHFHFEQVTLVELAQATSKYHRLSGSYNRNVFSHSPEGLLGRPKSKVRVPADCVSGKSSLPGLQMVAFPLCSHGLFFVCMERERASSLVCLLMRALIPSWGPTLVTSSKPNHLPSPSTITLESGLQCLNLCVCVRHSVCTGFAA